MKNIKKRAFAIVLVLGVIVFVGILIFSFSRFTQSQRVLIHKSFQKEVCIHLAENVSNKLVSYINKRVLETASLKNLIYEDLVFQDILPSGKSRLDESEINSHLPGLVSYADSFGIDILNFDIEYKGISQILHSSSEIKPDPKEKCGRMIINIKVKYRKTRIKLTIEKEFRVVNLIPPVVSKFTLFVRNHLNETQVNCIENDEMGGKASGSKRPIVCYNTGNKVTLKTEDIKNKGYIFLGQEPWYLNLSSGNKFNPKFDNFGQEFQIMPWDKISTVEKCPTDEHNIKLMQEGFFKNMNVSSISGNLANLPTPSSPTPYNCHSNAIHLYGDRENPSPTLVIGDVRPRFLMYGSITWNESPPYSGFTEIPYYSLKYRRNKSEFLANPKTIKADTPTPPIGTTKSTGHCHDHQLITNPIDDPIGRTCPGKTSLPASFTGNCNVFYFNDAPTDANNYLHYMSRVVNGDRPYEQWGIHYNQCYDRIMNPVYRDLFDIPLSYLNKLDISNIGSFITYSTSATSLFPVGIENNYFYNVAYTNPLLNGMVKFTNDSGDIDFDGSLETVNYIVPTDIISNYVDLDDGITPGPTSLPNPNRTFDFLFIDSSTYPVKLHLNSIVKCNTTSSEFVLNNRDLTVEKGGWIVCDKSIRISAGIDNSKPDELLAIISTMGDIIIDTDKTIHASLIALNGKIRKTGNRPLSVYGNIAVKELDPSIFDSSMSRTGNCPIHTSNCYESFVMYDSNLNYIDSNNYKKFYRVLLSPANIFVKVAGY